MNIKFEEVFHDSFSNIKQKFLPIFGYSLLIGVMLIGVMLLATVFGLLIWGIGIALGSVILLVVAALITLLFTIFIGFPLMYLMSCSTAIVARTIFENELGIIKNIKNVATKSNILMYFTSVFLPIFGIVFAYITIGIVTMLINPIFGIAMFILLFVPFLIASLYIQSLFDMSLYLSIDLVSARTQLLNAFSRKQIFFGYLIPFSISFIVGIFCGFISLIPIIGSLASMVLTTIFGVGIMQAMIVALAKTMGKTSEHTEALTNDKIIMKSDTLTVSIEKYGAQITSVVKDGEEIMWQADPAYWNRTAPVLFPFVGRLKDDKYQVNDDFIEMKQHGFLRDRIFKVVSKSDEEVTLEYTSTLADYNVYPVDFTVQITYRVFGSKVTTTYNVINNSSYAMPYQIGAHPGFNCESVNDLKVVFPPQTVTKHSFRDGLQTYTETVELNEIALSYDMLNQNIPCFSEFTSPSMTLRKLDRDYLKFDFTSMNYLAIWSPEYKNAKFICIEPWNGICSRSDQPSYLIKDKDGMNTIAPNSNAMCSYSFEVC